MLRWDQLTPKQRRKRKKAILRQSALALAGAAMLAALSLGIAGLVRLLKKPPEQPPQPVMREEPVSEETEELTVQLPEPEPERPSGPAADSETATVIGEEIYSEHAIVIDADENIVLASKDCDEAVYPASMTKVMALLTAAEAIDDPQDTFTMTAEILSPLYRNDATITGYSAGETVTLRDLFYGAALRSAADATQALACYVSGSEQVFAERMNEKAREMGLSESTHFTNTSGLFAEEHRCTMRDMAAIMLAAMQNELLSEVLSTSGYTAEPTDLHTEGLMFDNKYLRWFEERQPTDFTVTACKSGYIWQAKNCMVSYGVSPTGKHYICATAGASNAARLMKDHRLLYETYGK